MAMTRDPSGAWLDGTANVDIGSGDQKYDDYLDFDHPHAPLTIDKVEALAPCYPGILEEEWDAACENCSTWTCPDDRCAGCTMPPIED